ncbi:Set domain containing hypothetical protein [Phytophthora palmivora]|uniref:SET domain-containing protein n=1 Tax=Phytophthora palmivora TaxID=4796 RepID=A0A2P4YEI6_9STRA|nr:Set domain containing hypothetical protein [Phytophthora palmivora]
MTGLSASELPLEALRAGDVIEYYSRAFVCGNPQGHRRAIVTRADGGEGVAFPIAVDTGEVIPRDMMLKRVATVSGDPVDAGAGLWRKLRTFQLVTSTFSAPSRASALNKALSDAVAASWDAVRNVLRGEVDETLPETPQRSACGSPVRGMSAGDVQPPSTPPRGGAPPVSREKASVGTPKGDASEENRAGSSLRQIIDLVSPGENSGEAGHPSEDEAAAYMKAIPSRYARAKIRHQCAVTKSGNAIYHAKTFRAAIFKNLQKRPEVQEHLENLHTRRTTYPDPAEKAISRYLHEVAWPVDVKRISSCIRNGVRFPDIGSFDPCHNAPRTLDTLKLYETARLGLGVYTATDLDIGDVLGEYCGELAEFPAKVEGQPPQAVKQNSGFTLLYNAKSVKKNYVYVDALRCGSITRFLSHDCNPNAAFVEQQTRSRVRVLVKMIRNVKAGTQITMHYGNER